MRLKIITYNIHKGLAPGNRRTVLAPIREALHEEAPDILLLQEVVDEHARYAERVPGWSAEPQAQYIARGLRHAGAYIQNATHAHGGHGNAILTQFRVGRCRKIEMSVNRWEQRGLLHATVRLPDGQQVHVACVHLNLLDKDRVTQLGRLCRFVNREVPSTSPLIVGGDFNDWRGRATRVLTEHLGVKEVMRDDDGRHTRTFPAWRPMLALDRIYVRNLGIERASVLAGRPWSQLSDHLPVTATLTVSPPDQARRG